MNPNQPNFKQQQQQYTISLICRNGPIPQHNRSFTDLICTILYLLLLITVITFAFINYSHIQYQIFSIQHSKLANQYLLSIPYFILQNILSALALTALSFIIVLLSIILPSIMPFIYLFIFIVTIGYFSFFFFSQAFTTDHLNQNQLTSQIIMGIIFLIGLISLLFFIVRKRDRITKLGHFSAVNSTIIKNNCTVLLFIAIILSLFEILVWWLMVNLFFLSINLNQNPPIPVTILTILTIILWLWTHGLLIAISDFIFSAIAINWYFSKNDPQKSIVLPSFMQLFKYHFGNVVFGSILAYIPDYILGKVRKDEQNWVKYSLFWLKPLRCLSKYCYVETILQGFNFWSSCTYTSRLRNEIKYHFPKIYMLGHLMGDIMKVFLSLVGGGAFYFLVREKESGKYSLWILMIPILLSIFGLFLQIATNFANLIGKIGDIGLICYGIDLKIQRTYYGLNGVYSCPQQLLQVIRSMSVHMNWDGKIVDNYDNRISQNANNNHPYFQENYQNVNQ